MRSRFPQGAAHAARTPASTTAWREGAASAPSPRRLESLGQVILGIIAIALYLWFYLHDAHRPHSATEQGWILWFDQGLYYKAALAWAHGNLDPAQHWYLPGYALFAAPFAALMPLHAFLVPDLLALLAAMWLFGRLTARLAPELPCPALLGSAIFLACSVALPTLRGVWVVPNSSSLSTPIIYGCLLASVLFCTDDGRPRYVFLAALASCALAGLRPSDAMGTTAAAAGGIALSLLIHRGGPKRIALAVLHALLGLLVVAMTLGLAYVALYGLEKSGYVVLSMMLGFEWRLLPLRWVLLVLDPRPILAEGKGLIEGFPWIVPGMAGCAAACLVPAIRERRMANGTVIAAAALHTMIYLCYRDLHPAGLFQFSNFHYFKWVLPLMALYALRFAWALSFGPKRVTVALAGILPLMLLLPWHVSLDAMPNASLSPSYAGDTLHFTADFNDLSNVLLVPSRSDPSLLFSGGHSLVIGGRDWGFVDFRAYPQPGGFMLTPLRQLGSGPADLRLEKNKGVLDTTAMPVLARQDIAFGLPCFVLLERAPCRPTELLAPVMLAETGILTFDGDDVSALPSGWSYVELSSRYTDGRLATIRFRVPPSLIGKALTLELVTGAYQPAEAAPLRSRLQLNGVEVAQWKFDNANRIPVTASIPSGVIGPDGIASFALRIDNPRSPHRYDPKSNDTRELGMLVNRLQLSPVP